jgi:hypothetical protein
MSRVLQQNLSNDWNSCTMYQVGPTGDPGTTMNPGLCTTAPCPLQVKGGKSLPSITTFQNKSKLRRLDIEVARMPNQQSISQDGSWINIVHQQLGQVRKQYNLRARCSPSSSVIRNHRLQTARSSSLHKRVSLAASLASIQGMSYPPSNASESQFSDPAPEAVLGGKLSELQMQPRCSSKDLLRASVPQCKPLPGQSGSGVALCGILFRRSLGRNPKL